MNKVFKSLIFIIGFPGIILQVYAEVTVYVPLGSANEILVVDGQEDRITGHISGVTNVHGLAATPGGEYLVAASLWETPQKKRVVPTKPEDISEEEHLAHHRALANESKGSMSIITIIDTSTQRVARRIEVEGGSHHIAVTPNGRYAVSTHTMQGVANVIDLTSGNLNKTISTGPLPNYVLATSDGKHVYVSNTGNNTISEIETEQWILRRNITTGTAPEHLLLSSNEQTLYVNNVGDGTVAAISLTDGKITKTYAVGKGPHGLDLSDDGGTLFVSSKLDNELVVIDLTSGKTTSRTLSPMPYHVTTISGTGKLYVSSRTEPLIWVLDQNSLEVRGEIQIRGEGHQMVVVER